MTGLITITCPHCGFSKELPQSALPVGVSRVTCPKCREGFPLEQLPVEPHINTDTDNLSGMEWGAVQQPRTESVVDDTYPDNEADPTVAEAQGEEPVRALLSIGELFNRSWDIYQKRFATLLSLMLAVVVLLLIPVGIFMGIGLLCSIPLPELKTPLLVAGGVTGGMIGLVAATWGYVAFVFAVADRGLNAGQALEQGWRNFLPVAWVFTITAYIVSGGYFLLIIPGIIFSVLFAFPQFICISEGERGFKAVIKSRRYVKGFEGEVFARMVVIWVISGAVGMVPFVGGIVSILFVPYTTIYSCLIYEELRRLKGPMDDPATKEEKYFWLGVPLLGYLLFPIIFMAIFGAALIGLLTQVISP